MDNLTQDQLKCFITHQVEHAVEDVAGSPTVINRTVGEAMRHIGAVLEMNSVAYLPVRQEEILVKPELVPALYLDALLLIARTRRMEDMHTFLVLAKSETIEGLHSVSYVAYKPDNFDLRKTKFLTLVPEVNDELIRQLKQIVVGDDRVLLQCLIVKNFFGEVGVPKQQQETPETEQVAGGLPPVMDDQLL